MRDLEYMMLFLKEIVSSEMPRISNWTQEQKVILWENALSYFVINKKEFPDLIEAMFNERFKLSLAYDEVFCQETGIDYAEIDKHWGDIRAVIALKYLEAV